METAGREAGVAPRHVGVDQPVAPTVAPVGLVEPVCCPLTLVRGERCLFDGLDFALEQGEMLLLEGRNGCGKTSLLRVLCGLTLPETGAVSWRGRRVMRSRADYHAEMAYIGHRESLKGELSARENLAFDLRLRHELSDADIDQALEKVGLGAARDVMARGLSAGQKRRVSLARALASVARCFCPPERLMPLSPRSGG